MKIAKGDTVQVITGNDSGKTGRVIKVFPHKEKIVVELYDKLETGNDLFRAWLGYMNSHLTETEQLLVDKTKEFLGEDDESRGYS